MTDPAPVSVRDAGQAVVATVEQSEFTSDISDALATRMQESAQADGPPSLVVDLSKIRAIDSVALGALVVLLRRVKQNQGRLALVGLSGHAMKVLQVTGLEKVFELFDDIAAAMESLSRPT